MYEPIKYVCMYVCMYGYCYHLFFVLLISCLVGRFEFLFLFRFEFCLRTGEAYFSFLNCFYFYFSIPQCLLIVFARSALFYKSLLYFSCFICYCSVYCCFRHVGENALLLYVENANALIDTGLSEDKINKIVYGLTMFP